ncbi:MAG: phage integrase N-terminal SAM-like domain-containing protein, partial [Methylotenera sp.]
MGAGIPFCKPVRKVRRFVRPQRKSAGTDCVFLQNDPAAATLADTRGPMRLLARLSLEARRRRLSLRTEKAYRGWVRRFVLFHGKRHPDELGAEAVSAFLTALAVDLGVAAATQNKALAALLFLYREVLGVDLGPLPEAARATRPKRLPVVLSRDEARLLIAHFGGVDRLVALLLYGGGLRLLE